MIDKALNKLSKYYGGDFLEAQPEVRKEDVEPKHISLAKTFHGLHEVHDNKVLKALLRFDPANTPWCAGFVNQIEKMCGRQGTGKLLARNYLKYGASVSAPKLGDIVVFKRGNSSWQGHVGYFILEDAKGILTLGGNQNNKVCYKYYPRSKLLGFRRPL